MVQAEQYAAEAVEQASQARVAKAEAEAALEAMQESSGRFFSWAASPYNIVATSSFVFQLRCSRVPDEISRR